MHWGPRADRLGELVQPTGVMVDVELRGSGSAPRQLTGELLEVRDDGLLLLTHEIVLVPFTSLDRIDLREHPLRPRRAIGQDVEEFARTLGPASRHPFGMDEGAVARMLEALQQKEVVRVQP